MRNAEEQLDLLPPAWTRCEACDEYVCNVHHTHVADCPCPPIDIWVEAGKFPYRDPWLTPPGEPEYTMDHWEDDIPWGSLPGSDG